MGARRTEHAEAIDDLVRHELGVGMAARRGGRSRSARARDVVGERRRHPAAVAVALDEVGDVVADHAAEPAALVALVGEVVADVRGGGDEHLESAGSRPAGGRLVHRPSAHRDDQRVGELQDEPVRAAPDAFERPRAVARHPTRAGRPTHGMTGLPRRLDLAAVGQLPDGVIAASVCRSVSGRLQPHAPRRVAPPDRRTPCGCRTCR